MTQACAGLSCCIMSEFAGIRAVGGLLRGWRQHTS